MNYGHFSGQIKKFVDNAVSRAKGVDGQLYKIMNAHGFYDVADENNGLTDWQRASVPEYNQHRISDLCDAIADMFADILSNDQYGILYPNMDDVVGTLDMNATINSAELDVVGGVVGGMTAGASETARQSMGQLTAILMGGFKFDPKILPPLTLNMPGLPISIANAFKPGSYAPDWTFLYDHETVKSNKYYAADDGGVAISSNIKLNMGPSTTMMLKLIFSVPDVDENGIARGDVMGGISQEQFNQMLKVAPKPYASLTEEEKNFELDALQIQLAYFRYVQLTLWGTIKNPDNWAYLHWGCLTHNSCPTAVKTAVCSFIHTNGFAIDPQACPEAGLVSYCVNTGMAYLTGRKRPTPLYIMPGMTYLNDKKEKVTATSYGWSTSNNGVPVDKHNADLHFALLADILSHLTYDTNPNRVALRKQRVDEANLIYNYLGMPTMKFGDTVIPPELSANSMDNRGFKELVKATIKVYDNKNATLPLSDDNFKITLQSTAKGELSDVTIKTIKYILAQAGLKCADISSIYRNNEDQGRVMFNERQANNGKIVTSRAKAGQEVNAVYTKRSKEINNGHCIKIEDPAMQKKVRDEMVAKIEYFASKGTPVSLHGYDPTKIQAVDIAPNGTKAKNHCGDAELRKLHTACWDAYEKKYLKQYLCPASFGGPKVKDPAFHLEIWQDDDHPHPEGLGGDAALPSVDCVVLDENLKNKNTWDLVYVHDQTLA